MNDIMAKISRPTSSRQFYALCNLIFTFIKSQPHLRYSSMRLSMVIAAEYCLEIDWHLVSDALDSLCCRGLLKSVDINNGQVIYEIKEEE